MLNPTLTTASANASRHEVVNWFNSLSLSVKDKPIKLVTVDELVDGVPVCLFFSKLFPSKSNLTLSFTIISKNVIRFAQRRPHQAQRQV